MIRVIIVDDHPVVRRGLKQIIIAVERDTQVEFAFGFAIC
jgi:YesN/AraC family two-component response regulator